MVEAVLRSVAFPKLDAGQMASLDTCPLTALRRYRPGEKIFETGERDCKFIVIKTGEVEIIDDSADAPRTLAVLGPGEFTGDVAQLTGAPTLVTAVARTECEVYVVSQEALRQLINMHLELGDLSCAFLARRQLLREGMGFAGLRVIGSRYSRDTFRVRDFLAKNRIPYTWLDLETDPQVKELLARFGVGEADTPVVTWGHRVLLRNPSDRELAEALGLRRPLPQTVYDLVVVGAGPAGLAAAVYGASEGLNTLVLERTAPGGQAGRSMRIENYLGFPTGITGGELAERAVVQANKFGAHLWVATGVVGLRFETVYQVLELDDAQTVSAKCLLIATGADYRLDARAAKVRCGVSATPTEARVLGIGGRSRRRRQLRRAGGVFLAAVRKVYLVIAATASPGHVDHLAHRIEQAPNIEVLLDTEVKEMMGGEYLAAVKLVNNKTGEERVIETPGLFSFIGAVPRSDWLPPEIERDAKGFVLTGPAVGDAARAGARRPPLLETSRPGVYAAGDVPRARSSASPPPSARRHGGPDRPSVPERDVTAPST